ncbi:MAG: 3-deoxy-7-phosphoheptulonate synthase, partial [Butyricicoccus sp.]|nr:3-deoxy-7-phosphoheptulonate synthase [Butyricicoccus sp.]
MNLVLKKELPNPDGIKALLPTTKEQDAIKEKRAEEIKNILTGADDRFLLIIGPCSADRQDAVLDYMHRLRTVQDKVADKIYIIPRIYTNKPRTTGQGYKGMLHQPDPEAKPDM